MKGRSMILCYLAILLLAYVVPYTVLSSPESAYFTYLFWCVDALAAIALMLYVMRG